MLIRKAFISKSGMEFVFSPTLPSRPKRMYNNELHSRNPNLPYGEKREDDHVQVIGKILGTVSADEISDAEDVAILREIKAEDLYAFEREDE